MHAFTIRSIPTNLHHSWKTISSLHSVSMRLYILRALRRQVEQDIKTLKRETVLNERKLEEL